MGKALKQSLDKAKPIRTEDINPVEGPEVSGRIGVLLEVVIYCLAPMASPA